VQLPNIAQNGALVNKNICPKKYLVKLENLKTKSSPNLELIKVNFGRFFRKKLRHNNLGDIFKKKMRQTPKMSPKWRNFA
jgi:hypothetical protein